MKNFKLTQNNLLKLMSVIAITFLIISTNKSEASIDVKTYIPDKAKLYLPTLRKEQLNVWSDHTMPYILGGLVEQESCISLTHSRCWSPTSRLKTKREEGAGLGQITRAYNTNGSIRFDALKEMRALHNLELKELSWSNVYQRPDLQLKLIVLKLKDNYKALYNLPLEYSKLAMVDASYNGGMGRIHTDRRLCGLKSNCDPNVWFNNVELTCGASKKFIYGNRNACFINRQHVFMTMKIRSDKYKPWFTDPIKPKIITERVTKSIDLIKQSIPEIKPTSVPEVKPIEPITVISNQPIVKEQLMVVKPIEESKQTANSKNTAELNLFTKIKNWINKYI
jgi:hypothetical protein